MPNRDQLLATALSAGMIAAVLWPVRQNWRRRPVDGFPLSYYPMFSAKRRATARVIHLVGVQAGGRRVSIPYCCAGEGGLNQVRRQIGRACREGRAAALCALVAEDVCRRPALADVVEVELVESTYRLDDYFQRRDAEVRRRVLGAVAVAR